MFSIRCKTAVYRVKVSIIYFVWLIGSILCIPSEKKNQNHVIGTINDLNKNDVFSLVLVGLIGSIAVSVGGGAGIISMPIFISLMCVPFSQAVSFSSSIILGGVLCAFFTNIIRKKDEFPEYMSAIEFLKVKFNDNNYELAVKPLNGASLIDIQLVLFISPLLTTGSLLGMSIGRSISDSLPMFFLVCLLSYSLKSSITRFLTIRKVELTYEKDQPKEIEFDNFYSNNEDKFKAILYLYSASIVSFKNIRNLEDSCENQSNSLSFEIHKYDDSKYWRYFIILCFLSLWISFIDSGIFYERGTVLQCILKISGIFVLLLFPIVALPRQKLNLMSSIIDSENRLIKAYKRIFKNEEPEFHSIDIISYISDKSSNNIINYFLSGLELFNVGLIGGITGASGGILMSTILFTSQVDSSSIAANNSTCLLVSTLICFFTYLFEGRIMFDLAILMIFISILCTLLGKNIIDYYVKKYKLSSILTAIMICLISISLFYIGYKIIYKLFAIK